MLAKYFEIFLLLGIVCGAMALGQALDARAEHPAAPVAQDKRDAAAQRACPPGETAIWVDASTHECLREAR